MSDDAPKTVTGDDGKEHPVELPTRVDGGWMVQYQEGLATKHKYIPDKAED
jgi:hypothetical protein